jgi:hypothetical protein
MPTLHYIQQATAKRRQQKPLLNMLQDITVCKCKKNTGGHSIQWSLGHSETAEI